MPELTALFVYGTLRPRGRLHSWIADAVRSTEPALCAGYRLVRQRDGWFPYMVPGTPGEAVRGDLLRVDSSHPAVQATIDMEVSAGYVQRTVRVEGVLGWAPATALVWPRSTAGFLVVPGNDWLPESGIITI